jgi:hypothetical protein
MNPRIKRKVTEYKRRFPQIKDLVVEESSRKGKRLTATFTQKGEKKTVHFYLGRRSGCKEAGQLPGQGVQDHQRQGRVHLSHPRHGQLLGLLDPVVIRVSTRTMTTGGSKILTDFTTPSNEEINGVHVGDGGRWDAVADWSTGVDLLLHETGSASPYSEIVSVRLVRLSVQTRRDQVWCSRRKHVVYRWYLLRRRRCQ